MSLSNNMGCLGWLFGSSRSYRSTSSRSTTYTKPTASSAQAYTPITTNTTTAKTEKVAHNYKYRRKYLLTKNEWYFYKALKPIADEMGYTVLAKIRMADLVEPSETDEKMKYGAFQKIKAKHVDFALAKADNCEVIILIELDDNSHHDKEKAERDAFCDSVYRSCGYKVLRTYGSAGLREKILAIKSTITNS